ncbi:MAG: AAA family ATPase [Raineya sp.]|nr:AAA family ATPase [Raineya sp.]
MYISKMTLTNWKNFKSVEVDLQKRTFIVGPNASGKSNFLDAIRFLRDIVKQGGSLQEAVSLRGGVSKIRCVASRKNSDITIGIVISNNHNQAEWEYSLTFNQKGGGIAELKAIVKREFLKNLLTGKVWIDRYHHQEKDEYLLEFTHIEQAFINVHFKPFVDFLNEITYLHLIPQLIREPQSFLKVSQSEDYYGRNFFERISSLNKNTRNAYLRRIEKALTTILPNLEKLSFEKDEAGTPHLEATFKQWRAKGMKHTEKYFSDGTLRLIALFWVLLDGNKPVLLEEPELSLHSAIVQQLADIIYVLQKKKNYSERQVILTTHSYELLNNRGIALEEILLVKYEGEEGSSIFPAVYFKDIKQYLQFGENVAELILQRTAPKNPLQIPLSFETNE